MKGDDVEDITNKTNALMEASHKLAERMYQEQARESTPPSDNGSETADEPGSTSASSDDVVDAEFEEVKDHKD